MGSRKLWERALSFCLALLMIMTMMPASLLVPTDAASTTRLIYLNAGGSGLWDQGGAWFAAWVNSQWYTGNKVTGSIYVFEVPASATMLNFVRMSSGATTPSWNKVDGHANGYWNQTSDLTISSSYNCYTITGWGGSDGYWSTYTPASYYVAGTAALCGSEWQAGDSKNKMSIQGNGTYSITYTKVPAGSHQFKITVGSWNTSYGKNNSSDSDISASGDNCKITLPAVSNVTITFNPNANSNSMITVDIVKVQTTSYSVTWKATNVEISGASSVAEGEAYTATLKAASGYNLPDTITVKVGGNTITGYTYSNGNLTIPANLINGNIEITAEGVAASYSVKFNLDGVTKTAGAEEASFGTDYSATLKLADGYDEPVTIKVTAGGTELTSGTHYSYSSGNLKIKGQYITGAIVITASATEAITSYGVTHVLGNLTFSGDAQVNAGENYTATLTPATGYSLPDSIQITVGGVALTSGQYGYDKGTGIITLSKDVITDVVVIIANGVKTDSGEVIVSDYIVVGTPGLCGSDWDTSDISNAMIDNGDGTYTIVYKKVPAGEHRYKITKNGQWLWDGNDIYLNLDNYSEVTITYNASTNQATHTVKTIETVEDKFYVNLDLVDYLNNNRVNNNQVEGYYNDNQGEWIGADNAEYSYLNYLISSQTITDTPYSYPLYFGPLNYIAPRYGKNYQDGSTHSLGNWSSAANTALAHKTEMKDGQAAVNGSGVVQGLVGKTLDADGNLMDPSGKVSLLYFNKKAAEEWTNSNKRVMAYYDNLKFPFKQVYDPVTRVTTYSYDSATDYAVYYDYKNPQLTTSSTHVKDFNGANGFYPLNEAGDADNEVNNGFGAKFTMDFTVGKDGKLADGTDVTFKFTGDDDVWVFIDGKLILDMGGAHGKAKGEINFATKQAKVENAMSVTNSYLLKTDSKESGAYSNKGYDNWVYPNGEERARPTTSDKILNFSDAGLGDFNYNEVHTMTVFYMERGMIESNFSMEFTMVPVPSGLTISKNLNEDEINDGLLDSISEADDINFALSATSPSNTSVAFTNYTLIHKYSGQTNVVTVNGSISGKTYSAAISGVNNYVYAHSFVTTSGQDAFIPGTTFSIVETTNGIFKYNGTSWKVYDATDKYSDITDSVKDENADTDSAVASFVMGTEGSTTAYSYAVSFVNEMQLGNLSITKKIDDSYLADDTFRFRVYLDLDGAGGAFIEALYPGLVYTVGGETVTSTDGIISLTGAQTALISGIPAGATYRIEEITSDSDIWEQTSAENTSGTIVNGQTAQASFTNDIKRALANKVIYVEAGTVTKYTLSGYKLFTALTPSKGITATASGNVITITAGEADKVYEITYEGRLDNDVISYGTITVYTYSALDKSYVFDFGLSSNLEDISAGSGLFEDSILFNRNADGTTAQLWSIVFDAEKVASDKKTPETKISYTVGAKINSQDRTSDDVIFTPVAFMTRVETYTYTIRIVAPGAEFKENNPETGCVVTGEIRVMPANSVYYEDNFNVSDSETKDPAKEIVFGGNAEGQSSAPTIMQSNGQNGNYGYDSIYANGGFLYSNGNAAQLTDDGVNTQYAYFTFTGTGFDIISTTTQTTGGMAVYVFRGVHDSAYLDFILDLDAPVDPKDELPDPVDMVFVDTYYNDGSLYQIPVASVRLNGATDTYTVYIQALSTSAVKNTVSLDAVRIYNPMTAGNCTDYNATEINAQVKELRVLYGIDKIASLAGWNRDYGFFVGSGKGLSIIESMVVQNCITSADLDAIYKSGPNNEMYLPYHMGIHFNYTVNSSNGFTFQIGAKAITALNTAKKFSVNVRKAGTGTYVKVAEFELNTATDLYYDLTSYLKDYDTVGTNYDIIILNESPDANMEFVSLTTVKYSGITLS